MEANGLKKEHVKLSKTAIEYIVENYTRESGVRELEKKISKVVRKIALEIASDKFIGQHELEASRLKRIWVLLNTHATNTRAMTMPVW